MRLKTIPQLINSALRKTFRIEVQRYSPKTSAELRLRRLLNELRIDYVYDVGANTGQFATELLAGGYAGKIVSFEPLSAAHRELTRRAKHYPNWEIAPRVAIGAERGTSEIYIAGNSASSSLLPMLDKHRTEAPQSATVGTETVEVQPLDNFPPGKSTNAPRIFIKVDTQGFEEQVVRGGRKTLAAALALQMELTLTPLYDGQTLMPVLLRELECAGYSLHSLEPVFVDRVTGRVFQFDAIFVREGDPAYAGAQQMADTSNAL